MHSIENTKQKMSSGSIIIPSKKEGNFFDLLVNVICFDFSFFYKRKIAVLRLSGVIGKSQQFGSRGLSIESLNAQIEKAFSFTNLDCVCLVINSPGGSPVQSELIASRINSLSKEKKVPVYSFVEDVAASGGYWLACAGDEIYASKNSIVGSIGVISAGFGLNKVIEKIGIERRVYTSGNNKSILDPFSSAKESDIKLIQKIQSNVHNNFIDYVKTRRQGKLTQDDDLLFNGEFWTGDIAYDFGLIDGIDDMYSFIKRNFGNKAKIEYMGPKDSWIKRQINASDNIAKSLVAEIKHSATEALTEGRYNLE